MTIKHNNLLHHLSLPVSDLQRSTVLYDAMLSSLGFRRVSTFDDFSGYGLEDNNDSFGIKLINPTVPAGPGFHLAFSAPSRKAVDRFYEAAMEHGAADNGAPGLRPHYGETYYAAFVLDLDGNRLEAVHISDSTDG